MADWIPGVSQLKSVFQLVCLDPEGALETQKKFIKQCPVVSQVTSTVQLIGGDSEGALETQKECGRTLSNVANGIPVVGHIKGGIHYVCGDTEGGHQAMRSATRTTAVLGAGAAGMAGGGPLGAVGAGVAAGAGMDTLYSVATDEPQGYYAAMENISKNPSAGPAGSSNVDAGTASRAADLRQLGDGLIEDAAKNRAYITDGQYQQVLDKAANCYREAANMEANGAGAAGQAAPTGNLRVVGEQSVHNVEENDGCGQKKGQSTSTNQQQNNKGGKDGGSSNTSRTGSNQSTTTCVSGGSGQDPARNNLPNLKFSHYNSDVNAWIRDLKRSLGQLRSRSAVKTAGLNANADTLFTANRAIVEEMVRWVNTADLSEAARDYIIDTLLELDQLINYYQYSTEQGRIVQFRIEFEIVNANGDTYTVQFDIDVDNEFDGTPAHMGYEIRLMGKKVQVGHLYLRSVLIGRPPLAVFDRSTTVINGPQGGPEPIKDKKGIRNGKGSYKCTSWKVKKDAK